MMPTKVEHLIIIFFVFLCFHVVFPAATAAANTSGGLEISLELIHRDSERSPYYTAGLSGDERHERLVNLSRARLQWLKSSSSSMGNASLNFMRSPMYRTGTTYLVVMKVGSGTGLKEYKLYLDTGSSLTWIQCEPCASCYPQDAPVFVPSNSPSYRQAPCSDPLCRRPLYVCHKGVCGYKMRYMDKTTTSGTLSRETFGFLDVSGGSIQSVPNLAFGCSSSSEMHPHDKLINGILGMNTDTGSFAVQLASITNGIFSYCLSPMTTTGSQPRRSGYLHFGGDISSMPGLQMTRLLTQKDRNYYVTLLDVSVAGRRLKLGPAMFGKDGMVLVDSGMSVSYLLLPAYSKAKKALKAHFGSHGVAPVIDSNHKVCFPEAKVVEKLLPSFTFHFNGANLEVPGANMFELIKSSSPKEPDMYCWQMDSDDRISIIGAAQMVNKRFGFDLRKQVMLFAPETCKEGR